MSQKVKWTRKTKRKDRTDAVSESQNLTTKTGKVSLGLIKTILGEMKSEFNRNVNEDGDEECKEMPLAEHSDRSGNSIQTGYEESKDSTHPSKAEEKLVKVKSDSSKSRILLSSKTSNESTAGSKKSKSQKVRSNGSNCSDKLYLMTESEIDVSGTPTSISSVVSSSSKSGKRLLRSHTTAVNVEEDESAIVKCSILRQSRASSRKSVLLSTIGQKEQSFKILSQCDDKNSQKLKTSLCRSSCDILVDKNMTLRTSKYPVRLPLPPPKSPRLVQQIENSKLNKIGSLSFNGDSALKCSLSKGQPELPVAQKTMRSVVKSVHSNNTHTHTKTGKHRYRPYKGLRYSFTGDNVRRTKHSQRHVNDSTSTSSSETKKSEAREQKTEIAVISKERPTPVLTAQSEQLDYTDPIAKSQVAEFPSGAKHGICSLSGLSLKMTEAHQTKSQKWKFKPEEDDSNKDALC